MSDTLKGKLHRAVEKGRPGPWSVTWVSQKGAPQTIRPGPHLLARGLHEADESEIEVDLELDNGRPIRIRRAGEPWVASAAQGQKHGDRRAAAPRQTADRGRSAPERNPRADGAQPARAGHFHNPYNFIPAPLPKDGRFPVDRGLGHSRPVGHKAWYDGHYSGRLTVDIVAETPLLVPDASRAEKQGDHTILPLLTEANDGKTPKLPPTSFKGALRSAYEAITNSRMGIFQGHDAPLGRRMGASEGARDDPGARERRRHLPRKLFFGERSPASRTERLPFPTFNPNTRRWETPGGVMFAAWLRRYAANRKNPGGPLARSGEGNPCHFHGQVLRASAMCGRAPGGSTIRGRTSASAYWSVVGMEHLADRNAPVQWDRISVERPDLGDHHRRLANGRQIRAIGYVCVTGQNIKRKHDERVFFVPEGIEPRAIGIKDEWKKDWSNLIRDYRKQAELPRKRRKGAPDDAYLGEIPERPHSPGTCIATTMAERWLRALSAMRASTGTRSSASTR
ncbi:MAG: RAMP superfamily CRISPR-associated protein [Xanthobacteraceae bacterium]|nr:RAMP superfamily CRISPR-associated protein [Xanthobacteraceae bacterium]